MSGLGDLLDEIAGEAKVYDITDAVVRKSAVKRRVRTVTRTAVSLVAVVCMLGGVVTVAPLFFLGGGMEPPELGPGRVDGLPPEAVQPLLNSDTRGSLAGDVNYIKDVVQRIGDDPEQFGLPGDRAKLRILFAGDVPGNRRLVIAAGFTGAPRAIDLTGPSGTAAKKLELTSWTDVEEPVIHDAGEGYALVFGPAGYDLSVSSSPHYMLDGTVQRTWEPAAGDYLLRDDATLPPRLRVRMSKGDNVYYEGPVASSGATRSSPVDPAPLFGRGKPAPRAADIAANALAYQFGLTGPDVHYVVLWSDDFVVNDPNGQGSGTGQIATVMAVTADGGGPYNTFAVDTSPQPNGRNHPTGGGVAGDPAKALIAMRMPTFSKDEPDTLQIIAPPAAVRVEVRTGDTVLATAPLTNGVGKLELAGPLKVKIRVYDTKDTVVAERDFADLEPGAQPGDSFEPEIKGW
ncbi:hypothetical protein [Dactylosporangium sp. CA-139066]|uniref:hypothetical protein n=1 Tax=Dactylosporangium sp. CA-139066 TaxID=3239930 RepID=UPI003D8BEEF0